MMTIAIHPDDPLYQPLHQAGAPLIHVGLSLADTVKISTTETELIDAKVIYKAEDGLPELVCIPKPGWIAVASGPLYFGCEGEDPWLIAEEILTHLANCIQ